MAKAKTTERNQLLDRWMELESEHARVREALEHALQRDHRLSLTEYEVLRRLSDSPEGHRRIQELAEEIHLSQSALSRLVQRLEDDGYVCRNVCDHDRRGIYACITDEGRKAQDEAHPTHVSVLSETLAPATSA
ncbi:MAG TPA: MarR family transcriptional regulator [Solirubrobacterales bacterium]|jgi:DNA-binding MarR family transcriptional regulator